MKRLERLIVYPLLLAVVGFGIYKWYESRELARIVDEMQWALEYPQPIQLSDEERELAAMESVLESLKDGLGPEKWANAERLAETTTPGLKFINEGWTVSKWVDTWNISGDVANYTGRELSLVTVKFKVSTPGWSPIHMGVLTLHTQHLADRAYWHVDIRIPSSYLISESMVEVLEADGRSVKPVVELVELKGY